MNPTLFVNLCRAHGLTDPVPELRFAPPRRWRFDWAWESNRVAIEIQGGLWTAGRHVRPARLIDEYEKLNEAQLLGWTVLLVTPQQVDDGSAFALAVRAIELKGEIHE